MRVIPYKMASGSGKALAEALGVRRLRREGAPLNLRGTTVINWGCSSLERSFTNGRVLNQPSQVAISVNKLSAFNLMQEGGVPLPNFTEDREEALGWLYDGLKVVSRTRLEGSGGAGIVIAETPAQLAEARLYVRYMPKETEYRIHVGNGRVFFIQRKARRTDVPDEQVNWRVRNLEGGFIYANQNVEANEDVKNAAVLAVSSLGLDFGAVDLLVTPRGKIAVLEVNCAPGLAGSTLTRYVEFFQSLSQTAQ